MEDLNQEQEQAEQEQPDAIQLLAERLGAIESALGIGSSDPGESNLLKRLTTIEQSLVKPERERSLPSAITRAQAADPSFLRKSGIQVEDFVSGRIRVEG